MSWRIAGRVRVVKIKGWHVVAIRNSKTPGDWSLKGKNVGYLFAIQHVAKKIFDFDDRRDYATFQEAHTAIKSEGTIRVLSWYQGESRTPTSEDVELCNSINVGFLGYECVNENEPVALGVGSIRGNNPVVETDEGQSLSTGKGVLSRILLGWVSIQLLWGMFLQVNIMSARP
ncbi:hypothetical protein Tco_1395586, partial [Tanacetum coccineum]